MDASTCLNFGTYFPVGKMTFTELVKSLQLQDVSFPIPEWILCLLCAVFFASAKMTFVPLVKSLQLQDLYRRFGPFVGLLVLVFVTVLYNGGLSDPVIFAWRVFQSPLDHVRLFPGVTLPLLGEVVFLSVFWLGVILSMAAAIFRLPGLEILAGVAFFPLGLPYVAASIASPHFLQRSLLLPAHFRMVVSLSTYLACLFLGAWTFPMMFASGAVLLGILTERIGKYAFLFSFLVEEPTKHYTGLAMPLLELRLTHHMGPLRYVVFFMHCCTLALPVHYGVLVHILWNCAFYSLGATVATSKLMDYSVPSEEEWADADPTPPTEDLYTEIPAVGRRAERLIPAYKPGMALTALWPYQSLGEQAMVEQMHLAGWPEFLIQRYEANRKSFLDRVEVQAERGRRPDAPFVYSKVGKHKHVPRLKNVPVPLKGGKGFATNFHVRQPAYLPPEQRLRAPPGGRNLGVWRRYLHSQWWDIFERGLQPNEKICANLSAEMLLTGVPSPNVVALYGPSAELYVHKYEATPQKRVVTPMTLLHCESVKGRGRQAVRQPVRDLVRRSLTIKGTVCYKSDDLAAFAPLFRRHKPFLRTAEAYLDGATVGLNGLPLDGARIQATVDEVSRSVQAAIDKKAAVKDIKYQGAAMSKGTTTEPFVVQHDVHLFADGKEVSNMRELASEVLAAAGDILPEEKVRQGVQLVLLLVTVYRAEKVSDQFLALASYVASSATIWSTLKQKVLNSVVPQGDQDWSGWLYNLVFECGLSTLVGNASGAIFDMLREFSANLALSFRKEFFVDVGKRAAQSVVDGLLELFKRLRNCMKTRSFQPLFGEQYDPLRWEALACSLVSDHTQMTVSTPQANAYRKECVENEKYPPAWGYCVSVWELIDRVTQHMTIGQGLQRAFAKDPVISRMLLSQLARLSALKEESLKRVRGARTRPAPYMFFFYGTPGGGKTKFAQLLRDSLMHKFGYPEGSSYAWQIGVNFQSGLDHTTTMVSMDDVDQGVAPPAAGVRTYAQEVVALVNNDPYPVEESESSLKGGTFAYLKCLTYTTNFPNARVVQALGDPIAFWRRVHKYVTFQAKEEFSTGAGILDTAKASASDTWEMFDISVRDFDPSLISKNKNALPFGPPRKMSVSEFMREACDDFATYTARQNKLVEEACDPNKVRCSQCGLDTRTKKCSCPPEAVTLVKHQSAVVEPGKWLEAFLWAPLKLVCLKVWSNILAFLFVLRTLWIVRRVDMMAFSSLAVGGVVALVALIGMSRRLWLHYQARENNSTGILGHNWLRAEQNFVPGLPPVRAVTWTYEELMSAVKTATVAISGPGGGCSGVYLSSGVLLYPRHIAKVGQELRVVTASREYVVGVTEFNCAENSLNPEICVLSIPGLLGVRGVSTFVVESLDQSVNQFDELVVTNGTWTKRATKNCLKTHNSAYVVTTDIATEDGDCGALYLGRVGSGWRIVGMHYGLGTNAWGDALSLAGCVARDALRSAVNRLGVKMQGAVLIGPSLTKDLPALEVVHYPPKSEYWAAVSRYGPRGSPIGTMHPPPVGQTLKTKLIPSVNAKHAAALAAEWCGQEGYWSVPHFNGAMVNGHWESAFTAAFEYENEASIDDLALTLATMDYLRGCESLDVSGYATLSEEDAIKGIPGSYVRGLNLRTSVGPPYKGAKSLYYAKIEEGCYAREEMWEMYDYIETVLRDGNIPSTTVVWTLKDEALKPGKVPRTFNVFSAAFNLVSKRYFAPVHCFMRAHPHFFESFVGIDITGPDVAILITHLRRVDPTLASVLEKDVKGMDLSFHGKHWLAISRVYYAIAWALGVRCEEPATMILGLQQAVHVIKGDLFYDGRNPSGNDATVNVNGINLSLGERTLYYARKLTDPAFADMARREALAWLRGFAESPLPRADLDFLDYRAHTALATYGDDSLAASKLPLQPTEVEEWLSGYGFRVTDGQKEPELKVRPLSDCSFLKRGFVWDAELGSYVCPLSLKSLARTLMIKKWSTLSDLDNAAVTVSEVLRELVLHGEALYERVRALALTWAEAEGYAENPSFFAPTYAYWRERMKSGKFSTWEDLSDRVDALELSQVRFQSGKMESVRIVEDPNAGSAAKQQEIAGTMVSHPVGEIEGEGRVAMMPSDSTRPAHKIECAGLGDYLSREVEVYSGYVSDADPFLGTSFALGWDNWFANANVSDKVRSFKYYRGTLSIRVVFAIPGNCMGMYVMSALCNGGYTTGGTALGQALIPHNCMQVDHYAVLDCASTTMLELRLPFVYPYDYAEKANMTNMWRIRLTCLAPLSTSIPAGKTEGAFRVFMRAEDFDMIAPVYQGKKIVDKLQATHEKLKGMGISKTANTIAGYAQKASAIPVIGQFAAPVAAAAQTVSMVASWFGYTRETHESAPSSVTIRGLSNVAHYDGDDSGEVASLSVGNALSIDPTIADGESEDCAATAALFDRWTLVATTSWSPSDAPGSNILTVPVSPFYCMNNGSGVQLTTAGYFGLPFGYWRGDMHYRVYIPVSKLHRGTLQFFWYPDLTLPVGLAITNVTMNLVHEVTTGSVVDLTVGWSREVPMLRSQVLTSSSIINPSVVNGLLVLRVINPIQCQTDTPVSVLVFAKGDVDMDFAYPVDSVQNPNTADWHNLMSAVTLQGASGDEDNDEPLSFALTAPTGKYPVAELCAGERILSARALMQKPSILLHGASTSSSRQKLPHLGMLPLGGALSTEGWYSGFTYAGYYRALFVGIAASERVRVLATEATVTLGSPFVVYPNFRDGPLTLHPLAPVQPLTESRSVEALVPYYSPQKFSYGFVQYPENPTTSNRGTRLYYPAELEQFLTWWSLGPDARVVRFRQVPQVTIGGAPGTTYTYPDRVL